MKIWNVLILPDNFDFSMPNIQKQFVPAFSIFTLSFLIKGSPHVRMLRTYRWKYHFRCLDAAAERQQVSVKVNALEAGALHDLGRYNGILLIHRKIRNAQHEHIVLTMF